MSSVTTQLKKNESESEVIQYNEYNILIKIKQSDSEAFHIIYNQYHSTLFRFVFSRMKDYESSKDIVQETFVKVWLNRNIIKPDLSFLAYITKISDNIIKDHYKREKVRKNYKDYIPDISVSFQDNPEHAFAFSFLQQKIYQVVNNNLPRRSRIIFLLNRMEGKSNQEIADLLKITKKTVENQLNHALKILRKKLEKYL
jgi:RNA polymerase sigma-70 factor (family 1)